jgi:hypothetical protein
MPGTGVADPQLRPPTSASSHGGANQICERSAGSRGKNSPGDSKKAWARCPELLSYCGLPDENRFGFAQLKALAEISRARGNNAPQRVVRRKKNDAYAYSIWLDVDRPRPHCHWRYERGGMFIMPLITGTHSSDSRSAIGSIQATFRHSRGHAVWR